MLKKFFREPPGWRLVPQAPTPAILSAIRRAIRMNTWGDAALAGHWRSFLAAAGQNDDRTDGPAAQPSPETTLHADMLALIKDLQARGLTTTEDHERIMSIIERAGG